MPPPQPRSPATAMLGGDIGDSIEEAAAGWTASRDLAASWGAGRTTKQYLAEAHTGLASIGVEDKLEEGAAGLLVKSIYYPFTKVRVLRVHVCMVVYTLLKCAV